MQSAPPTLRRRRLGKVSTRTSGGTNLPPLVRYTPPRRAPAPRPWRRGASTSGTTSRLSSESDRGDHRVEGFRERREVSARREQGDLHGLPVNSKRDGPSDEAWPERSGLLPRPQRPQRDAGILAIDGRSILARRRVDLRTVDSVDSDRLRTCEHLHARERHDPADVVVRNGHQLVRSRRVEDLVDAREADPAAPVGLLELHEARRVRVGDPRGIRGEGDLRLEDGRVRPGPEWSSSLLNER